MTESSVFSDGVTAYLGKYKCSMGRGHGKKYLTESGHWEDEVATEKMM